MYYLNSLPILPCLVYLLSLFPKFLFYKMKIIAIQFRV